jgi:uncharacterized protein YqeY
MLIEKIKHDQLVARKNRDQIESTLLTTLIGEADMVGKNNGNRDPFDEEVISVVKKFLKGVNETIAILEKSGRDVSQFEKEREILDSYLPTQLTKEKIIVCPDQFYRSGNIQITAEFFYAPFYSDFESGIRHLRRRLDNVK